MGAAPVASDTEWLPAVGRVLGGAARVVGRAPLGGGYASAGVERVDLDVDGRAVPVVVKRATAVEVAAMRALAVVRGVHRPRALAVGTDRLVLPHYAGAPLRDGDPVPDAVWEVLSRVHAHWWRKRPRGLPVVDAAWWRGLCERTLVAVRGASARTGDPAYADAERSLVAWSTDQRIRTALAVLPRTLVHGDPHRGNVLSGPDGVVLIDWGNARVASAGLDLAVLRAQGATVAAAYERPGPPALRPVEEAWADVHVHVQYLGFAADHLGAARVAEMVATASRALDALDAALRG